MVYFLLFCYSISNFIKTCYDNFLWTWTEIHNPQVYSPSIPIVPHPISLLIAGKLHRGLIIWTLFMRILLNIWPLNGIRASKSLPLFTIIKPCWSSLTLQIHLLLLPLCLAVSITWHVKRTLFSWQMQKGNDLLLIYLFTLRLSPSNPPHLHHCTEGRFFNFLHENNAIAFLASPAKQAPAAHGDRWPPIIAECLIDPGREECVCVCLCARVRLCGGVSHPSCM